MPTYIRGPSVSYNGLAANGDLYNAIGFFDFTLPSDWDNTDSVETLTMAITAGVVADGDPPAADGFGVRFLCELRSVNGGSWLEAATNTAGNSLALGSVVCAHGAAQTSNWTEGLGLDQDLGPFDLFTAQQPTGNNCTLVDGAGVGFSGHSGEGFGRNGLTQYDGPIGWRPNQSNDLGLTSQALFNPGDVVTFAVTMWTESWDDANPDASIFGVLQSLSLSYKGTTYPIDLTAFQTGFGDGGSYTPVYSSIPSTTTYANARKTIDFTAAPTDHAGQRAWIDLWLTDLTDPDPDPPPWTPPDPDALAVAQRVAVVLRVATDPVIRLWSGQVRDLALPAGGAETVEGAIYQSMGQLTGLPELGAALNGEAERVEFTISGVAVTGEVAALANDSAADIRGVAGDVGLVLFDEDWQLVPPVFWLWSGTADSLVVDRTGDAINPRRTLRLSAGSVFSGRRRPTPTFFSDIDQRRRSSDDAFFDQISKLSNGSTKVWGVG